MRRSTRPAAARRARGCRSGSVPMSAWPSICCRLRRSAPWASRWLAKEWRRTCGETRAGSMPASTASSFSSWPKRTAGEVAARRRATETATGGAGCRRRRLLPEPAQRQAARRVDGRLGQRHHPLLAALAADDQHAAVARQRRQRQADQFGDAQAGGVEHLEQRRRAAGRAGPGARRRRRAAGRPPPRSGTWAAAGPASVGRWPAVGSSPRTPSASRKRKNWRSADSRRPRCAPTCPAAASRRR